MKGITIYKILEDGVKTYLRKDFIAHDPVQIPHLFTRQQDIEIAGLFAAIFSWGQRKTIISKSKELLQRMNMSPYDFVMNARETDLKVLVGFKHRTFNDTDLLYFIHFLQAHYSRYNSLEDAFLLGLKPKDTDVGNALNSFRNYFFSAPDFPFRTQKHIASPAQHSACKRLNMYLRWMVRKDKHGVDFGIWKKISTAQLVCPLDVHSGRVARSLGLLQRPNDDWQAALELTQNLRHFDRKDPVKYDFALFGLGVNAAVDR